MRHDIVIRADGTRLRPFRVDATDLAFLVRIAADNSSRQWSRSLRSVTDAASARAWLDRRLTDGSSREWVVEDESSGRTLGRVGLHRFEADAPVEVGYWTLPEARGAGVARRAARAVARHAHEALGEVRVGLVHAVANPASCRAALAASYAYEGTVRRALDHGDGVAWDMHVHGRVASDAWDPIAPAVPAGGPPMLQGDGLALRAWSIGDAAVLRSAADDPLIRQWNPIRVGSDDEVRDFVERMTNGMDSLGWAVVDAATGTVLGYVSLHHIDPPNAAGQIGYWVAPGARGRGVAARALATVAAYGLDQLGLSRIEVFHALANPASCRVASRAGFDLEGVRRLGYRYPDGLLRDEHLHVMIRG